MPHVEKPTEGVTNYLRLIGKPFPNRSALFVTRASTASEGDQKAPVLALATAATKQVIPFNGSSEEPVQEGISFVD